MFGLSVQELVIIGVIAVLLFGKDLPGVMEKLGGTYREDEINDVPGEITRAGNAWEASTSGITAGKTATVEAFGELNLPLLEDVTLIRSLTLIAAGRITNVKATRGSDA